MSIKTGDELLAAMTADPALRLHWRMGSRPAAPGMYSISDAQETRVYTKAVAALGDGLKVLRGDWTYRVYRLAIDKAAQ